MKPILPFFVLPLVAAVMVGCAPLAGQTRPQAEASAASAAATADDAATAPEAAAPLPEVELTPQLLHGFLLAEIAAQQGQTGDAAALYLELARQTRDPRIARRAAEVGLNARRFELALSAARLWREADPASLPARQMQLGLLAMLGHFAELKELLPAFLAAEPQALARNLMHLPRFFARGGDRAEVRAVIDAVSEPYLQFPEAHYARAQAAADAKDLPAARQAIARALELRPDWEAAALLRAQLTEDRDEAILALGFFVGANPGARDARLAYARALAGAKRYAEARQEFRALLEQSKLDPARRGDIVFAVAMLSLQLGDTAVAAQHLREMVSSGHAESDKARFFLGQIAADAGRWDEALQWFAAVGRGEHYFPARLQGARALAKQGRLAEARAFLTASEATTPQERAQRALAEAQLLRDARQHAEAHAVLTAALAEQPDQPDLLYEAALLAERLHRPEEGERQLRHLLEIKPDHPHALNALGYSLADRNLRLDEARSLIERALALSPDDPFILDSQGWVLFRLGERDAALAVLTRAMGLRADPEIAAHLGEVLWALGRRDEARHAWDKARQQFPDNEVLAETIRRFVP